METNQFFMEFFRKIIFSTATATFLVQYSFWGWQHRPFESANKHVDSLRAIGPACCCIVEQFGKVERSSILPSPSRSTEKKQENIHRAFQTGFRGGQRKGYTAVERGMASKFHRLP
jgi:hypothetical protein